jgi:hypothetical protein
MTSLRLAAAAALGLLAAAPGAAAAQVRASERAIVAQTVDGTTITVNYARPRVRGRKVIYGKEVKWGETWTPGANWATTIEISRDVTVDGHPLKKGKYSMWFVVREKDWTIVLDTGAVRYHTEHPDSSATQVRWSFLPQDGEFREDLTFTFPEIRPDGTQLLFEWAGKRAAFNVVVTPSHPLTIARAEAEPFIGKYQWKWEGDTASAGTMELYYANGMLLQRYTPKPDWYPLLQDQPMVRINAAWFIPTIVNKGQVLEMVSDMVFEFTMVNGKPTTLEIRDDKDNLLATGKRTDR